MSLHGCTVCTILQAVIVKLPEMTYIVSGGALNSTNSTQLKLQASVNEIADLQRIVIRQMSRPSSRQSVTGRACFAFLLCTV